MNYGSDECTIFVLYKSKYKYNLIYICMGNDHLTQLNLF